jgi:hypothetical protein
MGHKCVRSLFAENSVRPLAQVDAACFGGRNCLILPERLDQIKRSDAPGSDYQIYQKLAKPSSMGSPPVRLDDAAQFACN